MRNRRAGDGTLRRRSERGVRAPMSTDEEGPQLWFSGRSRDVRSVVIVLPGGRERGMGRVRRWNLVVLRMRPFVRAIGRVAPNSAIVLVGYRHRGWNRADPVEDVAVAARVIEDRFGKLPIVLVGHSMGGRKALRSAGLARVIGVIGLAPWIPDGEPHEQLADRRVLMLHGANDRTTSPKGTARFAVRVAAVAREVVSLRLTGTGHTMVRRAPTWHRLTAEAIAAILTESSIAEIGRDQPGIVTT